MSVRLKDVFARGRTDPNRSWGKDHLKSYQEKKKRDFPFQIKGDALLFHAEWTYENLFICICNGNSQHKWRVGVCKILQVRILKNRL